MTVDTRKKRKEKKKREMWGHQSGGYEPSSYDINKHTENDNDVSILKSSARNLSLLARRPVDYGRHKDRLQVFGSHKIRDLSCNRETKRHPTNFGKMKMST